MEGLFVVAVEGECVFGDEYVIDFRECCNESPFGIHVGIGAEYGSGTECFNGEGAPSIGSGGGAYGIGAGIGIAGRLSTEAAGFRVEGEGDGFGAGGHLTPVEDGELPGLALVGQQGCWGRVCRFPMAYTGKCQGGHHYRQESLEDVFHTEC